jgi:pyruvate formate lyase activating enzyme
MDIKYIQKTTLIDFPGQIASTIFVGGCNFDCDFCYNQALLEKHHEIPNVSEEEIIDLLKSRKKFIDGIAITGGEPTIQKRLIPFIKEIKNLGFKIKLDTNGYRPDILQEIIAQALVDYIAMDIKAPLNRYSEIANIEVDPKLIEESINILKQSNIKYEFRTTVYRGMFDQEEFEKMFILAKNAKQYFLQNFYAAHENEENERPSFSPLTRKEIFPILDIAKKYVRNIELRGTWY